MRPLADPIFLVPLGAGDEQRADATADEGEVDVPGSEGLKLVLLVRLVRTGGAVENLVPEGTRSLSLFLITRRSPAEDDVRDEAFAFQAQLQVESETPLVPRPNLRGLETDDWDERVADLHYRDAFEYAVGHGVSVRAQIEEGGACHRVSTDWIPSAEVERVAPAPIENVELGMDKLGALKDGQEAREKLGDFVAQYRAWIEEQSEKISEDSEKRREMAALLLQRAGYAAERIEAGIALLDNAQILDAFCVANQAMAVSARQRFGVMQGRDPNRPGLVVTFSIPS